MRRKRLIDRVIDDAIANAELSFVDAGRDPNNVPRGEFQAEVEDSIPDCIDPHSDLSVEEVVAVYRTEIARKNPRSNDIDMLDADVRALTAFDSWADLKSALFGPRPYTVTLHPTDERAVRLRRAILQEGGDVWPSPMVKLTGLTEVQQDRIADFLGLAEGSSDRLTKRDARRAKLTKTTATMSHGLAEDFLDYLDYSKDDAVDMAGAGYATTDEEIAFAERSVARSFAALIKKTKKAMKKAR